MRDGHRCCTGSTLIKASWEEIEHIAQTEIKTLFRPGLLCIYYFSFELPFSLMFSSDTRKERETQLAEHVSHRRPLRLFHRVSARLSLFPKTSNRGFSFHRCGEFFLLYVTSQTTKSQNGTLPFTLPLCIPSFPSPSKEKGWVGGKERNLLASESDQPFVSLSLCSPTA